MSYWSKWFGGRNRNNDFADAIRGELGEMRTPRADDALLSRIQASRRGGARVILPLADERRSGRPIVLASAVAAAAIAALAVGPLLRNGATDRLPASDSWFVDSAFASAPAQARYVSARVSRAERLRPMQLSYAHIMRESSGAVTSWESRSSLRRDAGAWRFVWERVRTDGGREIDSTWVSAADLTPVRQVIVREPYSRFARLDVEQRYTGLRVAGDMHAFRDGSLVAHRTFDRTLPADAAPFVSQTFAPLFLSGVEIGPGWTGRVALLGWLVRDDNVYSAVDFHFDADDVARVPAGSFPAWRLVIEQPGHRLLYWVRKSDGLGVRMLDSTAAGTREIALKAANPLQ
jgi:hypothetical protein